METTNKNNQNPFYSHKMKLQKITAIIKKSGISNFEDLPSLLYIGDISYDIQIEDPPGWSGRVTEFHNNLK